MNEKMEEKMKDCESCKYSSDASTLPHDWELPKVCKECDDNFSNWEPDTDTDKEASEKQDLKWKKNSDVLRRMKGFIKACEDGHEENRFSIIEADIKYFQSLVDELEL